MTSRCTARWSSVAGGRAESAPVVVLAGQVTLARPALREAGITAAHSIADYAGSVQWAMDDASRQLVGLARQRPRAGGPGVETAAIGYRLGRGSVETSDA